MLHSRLYIGIRRGPEAVPKLLQTRYNPRIDGAAVSADQRGQLNSFGTEGGGDEK